jgi:hypothetical protein
VSDEKKENRLIGEVKKAKHQTGLVSTNTQCAKLGLPRDGQRLSMLYT